MDHNQKQQIEDRLRRNWQQSSYAILDRFTVVSRADLDSATNVDDLVRGIADKSGYSERLVEDRISELVGVGAAPAGSTGSPFSGTAFGESPRSRLSEGGQT